MIYNNIELFNVAEIESKPDGSIRLHRFPVDVENQLGYNQYTLGRYVSKLTTGCEIRFVTTGNRVDVSLTAIDVDGEILVYKGDYLYKRYLLKKGVSELLMLNETIYSHDMDKDMINTGRFSSDVWRIIMCHDFICQLNFIESYGYDMRSPTQNEKPKQKWLAYGSSITHGAGAQLHTNSYIMSAARELGVDVLDKGMGGSCHLESAMADFIANEEWDFATFELGVNVREIFTTDEFRSRAEYLVKTIKEKKPDKPVIFITIFPNSATYCNKETIFKTREFAHNNIIREIYNEYASDGHTFLVEGSDILKKFDWLTCDLIHPSEYGHFRMGLELANLIRDIIE